MNRCLVCVVLLLTALPGLSQNYLPRDVQRFVDRREACNQMRGEIPDSSVKMRMNEVGREISKLCGGTDKELVQLKRKYAGNSTIMQILNQFDTGIELADAPARRK